MVLSVSVSVSVMCELFAEGEKSAGEVRRFSWFGGLGGGWFGRLVG